MAIINCPECNEQVSTEATNCPHCGYPIEEFLLSEEFDGDYEQLSEEITDPLRWEYKRHRRQAITRIVVVSLFLFLLPFSTGSVQEFFEAIVILPAPAGISALLFGSLFKKGIKDFFAKIVKIFGTVFGATVTLTVNLILLLCCGLAGIAAIFGMLILFAYIGSILFGWIPEWLLYVLVYVPFVLSVIFTILDLNYIKNHKEDMYSDENTYLKMQKTKKIVKFVSLILVIVLFLSCTVPLSINAFSYKERVDVFKYIDIKFTGLSGEGYVEFEPTTDDEYINALAFNIGKGVNGKLSNGEEVEIVVYCYPEIKNKYKKVPKEDSIIVTVSSLEEYVTPKTMPTEMFKSFAKQFADENQKENWADWTYSKTKIHGIYLAEKKDDSLADNKNEIHVLICYKEYENEKYQKTNYSPLIFKNVTINSNNEINVKYEDGDKSIFVYNDIEKYLNELREDYKVTEISIK